MTVVINVPENSRVDYIWDFSITGLLPFKEIIVKAEMSDLFGNKWQSHATFISNAFGSIELSQQAPISGTYNTIDPMGLIWSMTCEKTHGLLARRFDLSPATIHITVLDKYEEILATKVVYRYLIEPTVIVTTIREDGLVGTLYQPENPHQTPKPALIILSGSEGGFRHEQAALLASEGYVTLALAYFIHEPSSYSDIPSDFPKIIKNIPLEYFERAINFLQHYPGVNSAQIGVVGTSRGGELALLLGSMFAQINCVIAYVPNHAIQAAFGPSDHLVDEIEPSWTYHGTPLPCFPLKVNRVDWFNQKPVILKNGFITSTTEKSIDDKAIIPVENINGPILLISAGNDQMWPSTDMSEMVISRLRQKSFKYLEASQHLNYPYAGHLIMTPWWPTTGKNAIHPVDLVDYDFGGTPQADAAAGYESWQKIKAFLANVYTKEHEKEHTTAIRLSAKL